MKVLSIFVFGIFIQNIVTHNVVCSKRTSTAVTIDSGDSFSLKTQKGGRYSSNSKCVVLYQLGSTCSKMQLSCSKSNLTNRDKKTCKRGDKITVMIKGRKTTFCDNKKPSGVSTTKLKFEFRSNKPYQSTGASCTVKCTKTPSTTSPPSGTTNVASGANCQCGIRKSSQIIGGGDAPINEYMWMASLSTWPGLSQYCGGSVINKRFILTAAHCVSQNGGLPARKLRRPSSFRVVLGEHDLRKANETTLTKTFRVKKIIVHKTSKGKPSNVDLALIEVTEPIDLTTYTPLCLPTASNFNVRGKDVTLTGWGLVTCPSAQSNPTCSNGEDANTLQEIVLPAVDQQTCKKANGWNTNEKLFCWGGEKKRSGCFGDSGSPLTYSEDSVRWMVTGVVSAGTGDGCGRKNTYGLGWEVADYKDWIMKNVWGDFCSQ